LAATTYLEKFAILAEFNYSGTCTVEVPLGEFPNGEIFKDLWSITDQKFAHFQGWNF
jgi:hypothetical protein